MENKPVLADASKTIKKYFFPNEESLFVDAGQAHCSQNLRQLLTERIEYLMNHDYDQLMQILFRVDVNEEKLKQAFRQNSFDEMPPLIADLVIERQMLKTRFRPGLLDPDEIP